MTIIDTHPSTTEFEPQLQPAVDGIYKGLERPDIDGMPVAIDLTEMDDRDAAMAGVPLRAGNVTAIDVASREMTKPDKTNRPSFGGPENIEAYAADKHTRKSLGRVATSDDTLKGTRAHNLPANSIERRKQRSLEQVRANGGPGTRQHSGYSEGVFSRKTNKAIDKLATLFPKSDPLSSIDQPLRGHIVPKYPK